MPTVNLPAVTSSHDDLRDLAHRLSYMGGLLVGASGYGGSYGGTAGQNDGGTSEEATAEQAQARTSILPKANSTRSLAPGEADGGAPATVTGLAAELRRALARRRGLAGLNSGHWLVQGVAGKAVMLLR